ncbi:hypothetical protein K7X08_011186 [Anisodus acutangulus]|uniref:Uncharacterized protein n=1 Tax=Anisodus acutangulus TaxID=402998 RepID=A0A9Q1LY90_9SOLA|nr:hypothetical protein K7X08_011186 [Anisodus acutangulus]
MGVLHACLDGFAIKLEPLEQSGLSSDTGSLWTELQELRAAVQVMQAHDHVTLEDLPQTRHVDISEFVHVQQLVEDDDSPIATPADVRWKRKRDEDDQLSNEQLERTRARG